MTENAYACPGCGTDLTAEGAVEVRQVEHHAYAAAVAFAAGGPLLAVDTASDSCDEADGAYAMCGACQRVLDFGKHEMSF